MQKKIQILGVIIMVCLGLFCGCVNNNGTFYNLQEAYDNGWLTQKDLQSIAFYYNGGSSDESFIPEPKNPEILSKKTEEQIKKTYLNVIKKDFPNAKTSGISIAEYYGVYNDCIAVRIKDNYYAVDIAVEPDYKIGGVSFYNFTLSGIQIWREGNM